MPGSEDDGVSGGVAFVGGEGGAEVNDSIHINQDHVQAVESLGFRRSQAKLGIQNGDGTVTGAIEWILNNDEEFKNSGVGFSDRAVPVTDGDGASENPPTETVAKKLPPIQVHADGYSKQMQAHESGEPFLPASNVRKLDKDARVQIKGTPRRPHTSVASSVDPDFSVAQKKQHMFDISTISTEKSGKTGTPRNNRSNNDPKISAAQTSAASSGDPKFSAARRKQHMFDNTDKAEKKGTQRERKATKTLVTNAAAGADPAFLHSAVHKKQPGLETIPVQERRPISFSKYDSTDQSAFSSKQRANQKIRKEDEELKPGVPQEDFVFPSHCNDDYSAVHKKQLGLETLPAQERRPISLSNYDSTDQATSDSKQRAYQKSRKEDEELKPGVPREPAVFPSPSCDNYREPSVVTHSAVPGAHSMGSQKSIESPRFYTSMSLPGANSTQGPEGSNRHVVPTAYTVDEHIVEAQNVLPEDELGRRKRVSRKCAIASLILAVCVVAAVVFATLGATGQFGDKNDEAKESEEFIPTPAPTAVPRECFGSNCWVQKGPELRAQVAGDEFAEVVSLADSMALSTRLAVSAPESHAGGIESGLVQVFDVIDNDDGVAYWAQVGQDMFGLPGEEVLGYLSPDGQRLAVGAWLSAGPDGKQGSTGQVTVFELQNGGNWSKVGKPIYGEVANERFGRRVALNLDGTVIAASAQLTSGTIRIFEELDGEWVQRGNSIRSGGPDAEFGQSVSISHNGDVVCIGAQKHINDRGIESGIVRVYQFQLATKSWTLMGNHSNLQGEADGDRFGSKLHLGNNGLGVAISSRGKTEVNGTQIGGHVVVFSYDQESMSWERVGMPIWGTVSVISLSHDMERLAIGSSQKNNDTGYVRAYHFTNGTWQQLGGEIPGRDEWENFGSAVALDGEGNTLVVGGSPGNKLRMHGVVRVFELPWFQDVPDLNGLAPEDRFGNFVQLSGDGSRLAISISAKLVDGRGAGSVKVVDIKNGTISQIGQEVDGVGGDQLVGYLARNGMRMALGARRNNGINGTQKDIGKVTVYELSSNGTQLQWTIIGDPIYGESVKDRAGKEAAITDDGEVLAVTSPVAAGRGQTRVFRYSGMKWSPMGTTLDGVNADDQFGWQVSLSADGSIMAVSSRKHDGYTDGGGLVKVYRYDSESGNYLEMGNDIFGEEGDEAGIGISLSADGLILAVSMPGSDANGEDSGMVRVFSFDESANNWRQRGGNITGTNVDDELMRVSLTADGNRIATGAHRAGDEEGYVDVYDFVLGGWKRVGGRIWGETPGGGFGWAISLSNDGTRLAVGAPARNADSAQNADNPAYGLVRLFKLPAIYEPQL